MEDARPDALRALPPPDSCRLIDFEESRIVTLDATFPPRYVLLVTGTAPVYNLRVELLPLIYIRQPDYWGIEVVGCLSGTISLPALRPFLATLDLTGTTGTEGVEVIGAGRSQKLDVPPRTGPLGAFLLSITSSGGNPVASAWLTCSPDGGTHPQAAAACRQLTEANGHVQAIPENPGPCTREYKPVLLQAVGTWGNEVRQFSQEFSNLCEGVRATGGILFDFTEPAAG